MSTENRDWYRDWWRKKTGYVERAGFRMSEAERLRQKNIKEWKAILLKYAILAALIVILIVVKRHNF